MGCMANFFGHIGFLRKFVILYRGCQKNVPVLEILSLGTTLFGL